MLISNFVLFCWWMLIRQTINMSSNFRKKLMKQCLLFSASKSLRYYILLHFVNNKILTDLTLCTSEIELNHGFHSHRSVALVVSILSWPEYVFLDWYWPHCLKIGIQTKFAFIPMHNMYFLNLNVHNFHVGYANKI